MMPMKSLTPAVFESVPGLVPGPYSSSPNTHCSTQEISSVSNVYIQSKIKSPEFVSGH